jgi:hypothetical protein
MRNHEFLCALSTDLVVPTAGPSACGRRVCIEYQGSTTQCIVADKCDGCGPSDIRMTPATFSTLNFDLKTGSLPVSWFFCDSTAVTRTIPIDERVKQKVVVAADIGSITLDLLGEETTSGGV